MKAADGTAPQSVSPMDEHSFDKAADWSERERYWQRRLGRLRLGVEPLDVQLARYLQVTWGLTVVPIGMGLIIAAIFAAFHRLDIGLLIASILVIPIVSLAWLDYRRLERLVAQYEQERASHSDSKKHGLL
jgi:hypothetical protein